MPKTNYICVLRLENDYDACAKHEKEMHIKPAYGGIEPRYGMNKQYPDEIVVTFDNGATGIFQFTGTITPPEQKDLDPALKKFGELNAKFGVGQKEKPSRY